MTPAAASIFITTALNCKSAYRDVKLVQPAATTTTTIE